MSKKNEVIVEETKGFVTEEMDKEVEEEFSLAPVQKQEVQEVLRNDDTDFVGQITGRQLSFCSFEPVDMQGKTVLFNISNNPKFRIGDEINETINVAHIFAENVTCKNEETGEQNTCPRIVLIDDKGEGHQSVSLAVFGATKKLMQCFGHPSTWEKPIPVKIKQITKGKNKMLTFDVAL